MTSRGSLRCGVRLLGAACHPAGSSTLTPWAAYPGRTAATCSVRVSAHEHNTASAAITRTSRMIRNYGRSRPGGPVPSALSHGLADQLAVVLVDEHPLGLVGRDPAPLV